METHTLKIPKSRGIEDQMTITMSSTESHGSLYFTYLYFIAACPFTPIFAGHPFQLIDYKIANMC
jgi:hypothetical protein